MSKLTDGQREEIVRRYTVDGVAGYKLAPDYGVRLATIYRVLAAKGVLKRRGWNTNIEERCCRLCKEVKPLGAFAQVNTRPDWHYRGYECKPCLAKEHRERGFSLKNNTGLTLTQYNELLDAQGGGCAICGTTPKKIRLSVDHDHATGMIRGLLCHGCNTKVIGFDRPEVRSRIEAYLASPPATGRGWAFRNSRRTA